MKEQEMIRLLSHYRHDWLNELQLMLGYVSMGKTEKVEKKIRESIASADEERKLSNLGIPKTVLWIISFNWKYDNFRIRYESDKLTDGLVINDECLHHRLDAMMQVFTTHSSNMVLYRGIIKFLQKSEQAVVEVNFEGDFPQAEELYGQLRQLDGNPNVTHSITSNETKQYTITWVVS